MSAARLTDRDIEQIIGQTPCLCGDVTTWHFECYQGKTDEQIKAAYKRIFAKLRKTLRADAGTKAAQEICKLMPSNAGSAGQ